MRRSIGSLSRLLAVRSGAVVQSSAPGAVPGSHAEIQADALTRVLAAEGGANRPQYDQATFRVEGVVCEASKRHVEPAYLILQGHAEGEVRHRVVCYFGTKQRDSLHGVEVGNHIRLLGEYHLPEGEPGADVTLTACTLVR